jgi:chromate transporter
MAEGQPAKIARLRELAVVFLKLGVIGFGGPAAHLAMMEDEVVTRRHWLEREQFLDLVGATNLIPGPNSTEMAIHIGYVRAGWAGLAVAGLCFILPAVLITAAFAWMYVRFGKVPDVAIFLFGIKPAVLAIILTAIWRLGKTAVKSWPLFMLGMIVALTSLLGMNEVLALFLGGMIGMFWLQLNRNKHHHSKIPAASIAGLATASASKSATACAINLATASGVTALSVSLWKLGLFFLKVGAVLYGSGYVLVAFLEGGLVREHGWLTQQQLLDAIAIGQFTPGPLLSTATFIGYVLSEIPGAVIATIAIFLPSFFFVAMSNPFIPRLRRSPWTSAFLDAINISSVALMAAVTVKLGHATLTNWAAWIIAISAAAVGFRWKVNAAWLVVGGAIAGWLLSAYLA